MKAFVFWTGLLSGAAGIALQLPALQARLFSNPLPGLVMPVFGLVAVFLGLMLVLCARDLRHRGVLVGWEGVLRVVGGAVIAGYGFLNGHGLLLVSGVGDLIIGAIYMVGLPRHLRVSTIDLLLDRR
ncbi:MAG: hypothetical protein ACOYOL_11525 [Chthoniobacterales bacterium]